MARICLYMKHKSQVPASSKCTFKIFLGQERYRKFLLKEKVLDCKTEEKNKTRTAPDHIQY